MRLKLFEEFNEDDFKKTLEYLFLDKKYKAKRTGETVLSLGSTKTFPKEAVGKTFFVENGLGYEFEVKVLDAEGNAKYRMVYPFREPPLTESIKVDNLKGEWFHGDERKTDFVTRNYFDVTDFTRDRNAMGPGIYFTRLKYQATGYAGDNGYVYTATVDLDPKRTLEDKTKIDESKLRTFIEQCPNKDLFANYTEDIDNGVEVALNLNMESSSNMLEAIMGAYNDLYQRDAVLFAKVMVDIGYDAFYHKVNPREPEAIHLIVYNPKIIKVLKEEKYEDAVKENRIKNFNNFINESEENKLESSEVFDKEAEAKKYLSQNGYRSVGHVKMPEGYEHVFVEQFEDNKENIARLVWLGNIKRKDAPPMNFPADKWQLTIINPGHKNYEKAKTKEL